MMLGRHFPTDVIGGTLLAIFVFLVTIAVVDPRPRSTAANAEPLPQVFTNERRLAVILNPIKVEDVGQFRAVVGAMAKESGWSEPTWQYTTVEDPGTGMAEKAAVSGADLVIVCGGDGTVREVCAELAGTGIPVGIIPAGTGNLLARNLDIPLYIRAAIDVALNGQDRAIDLVRVGGDGIEDTHFMVMAGMGFDAAIMEGVNEEIKKKIGWIAYVVSGLRSLMFPAIKVEIQIDDEEPTTHRARTVVVGNVGFLQAGMPLLPDATIDDGILDVVIIHPRQFLSWITVASRVLRKSTIVDETLDRRTGSRVRVKASAPTPRASSTATRSARAASSGWSASTAGCWSASRAEARRRPSTARVERTIVRSTHGMPCVKRPRRASSQPIGTSRAGVLDRLVLLGRELLLARPGGDRLGVGPGLAAAVDRGEHHAVPGVVEEGEAPAEVPADVAEGVVAHDRQVPQRVAVLRLEGGDLLPQAVDVLGQGVHALAVGARRRTTEGEAGEHAGQGGEDDGDHIEHAASLCSASWSRPVGHGRG